jgi:hypothetical protein
VNATGGHGRYEHPAVGRRARADTGRCGRGARGVRTLLGRRHNYDVRRTAYGGWRGRTTVTVSVAALTITLFAAGCSAQDSTQDDASPAAPPRTSAESTGLRRTGRRWRASLDGPHHVPRPRDDDHHCCPSPPLRPLRATWPLHGARHRDCPGTSRRRTLFGVLDLATGAGHQALGRRSAAEFTAFLQAPPDDLPHRPGGRGDLRGRQRPQRQGRDRSADRPRPRLFRHGDVHGRHRADRPGRPHQVHAFFRHRSPARMPTTAAPWTRPGHRRTACTTSASRPAAPLRVAPPIGTDAPSAPYTGPERRSRMASHRPRPERGGAPCPPGRCGRRATAGRTTPLSRKGTWHRRHCMRSMSSPAVSGTSTRHASRLGPLSPADSSVGSVSPVITPLVQPLHRHGSAGDSIQKWKRFSVDVSATRPTCRCNIRAVSCRINHPARRR